MRIIIDDWRRVLKRSAAVLLSYVATVSSIIGGGLFLMAERLGNERTFYLIVACALLSATCTALIPVARIVRQPKLRGGDDADQ